MEEPDFDWSLGGEAETTSGETSNEQTSQNDEAGSSNRERDDKGRFVSRELRESGEEQAVGQDNETDGEAQDLILGKFKSVEALQEAYVNLEKLVGQKGANEGELRKELDAIKAAIAAQQAPAEQQYAPVDNQTIEALDELAAANPRQAAEWALQYQPLLYDRVMETWFENDPRGASRFETAITLNSYQQELAKSLAPTLAPLQQQGQQQEFATAWAKVADKHPDIEAHADAMLEAAQGVPEIIQVLQSGDAAAKERMIENLLFLARGRQAGQIADAAAATGRKQATDVEAEKLAAAVASGSSAQTRGEKTGLASWKEAFISDAPTNIWQGLETKK